MKGISLFQQYIDSFGKLLVEDGCGHIGHPDGWCVCPICLEPFSLNEEGEIEYKGSGTSNNRTPHMTVEHVPPKALGGKTICLTCNRCNSDSGNTMDKAFLDEIKILDSMNPTIAHNHKCLITTGSFRCPAHMTIKDKTLSFYLSSKSEIEDFVDTYNQTLSFDIKVFVTDTKRNKEAAMLSMLKQAYLFAFITLKDIYLYQESLDVIRNQINPSYNGEKYKSVFPQAVILKEGSPFNDVSPGLYKGKFNEYNCIFVFYKVRQNEMSPNHKIFAILPGENSKPGEYELALQDNDAHIEMYAFCPIN